MTPADALDDFVRRFPEYAAADLRNWVDQPLEGKPLGLLAMVNFDTTTQSWRTVSGTGAAAQVLIAAGAPVDGWPDDRETPLITAASYGDAEIAAVLIAAGADLDATAAADAGGVPGGTALLHAAVFGMTDVVDLLASAGASVSSLEEAAAIGDLDGWNLDKTPLQTRIRALVMAAHHQRIAAIAALAAAGTPIDDADEVFGRHPLRLAAANGRPRGVDALLRLGADPARCDAHGRTPLDLCRAARSEAPDPAAYDEVIALLSAAS